MCIEKTTPLNLKGYLCKKQHGIIRATLAASATSPGGNPQAALSLACVPVCLLQHFYVPHVAPITMLGQKSGQKSTIAVYTEWTQAAYSICLLEGKREMTHTYS